MKNYKYLIIPALLFSLQLTSCNKNKELFVIPPVEEGKVQIHSVIQRVFLNGPLEDVNLYVNGSEELSRPQDISFSWPNEFNQECTLHLSENKDYSNSIEYPVGNRNRISFNNLKIGTTYYFYVDTPNNEIIYEESFTVSSEIIRNMHISGVTNARDLGGYPISGNRTLNQGLIYRTGRLNENDEETVVNKITSSGISTMVNDLKIKSEIDLRRTDNNEVGGLTEGIGVLGDTVSYYQCPMDYSYDFMGGELNDSSLRKVFTILGDKDNYPLFFHCSIGTDRTGYLAYLINAFLGVSEDHLYRDYLFSNFGNIGGKRSVSSIENNYPAVIKAYRGDNLQEKTKNYLLDKGVKQEELNILKEMMIPER